MSLLKELEIFEPSLSIFTALDFPVLYEEPELSFPRDLFDPRPNLCDAIFQPFEVFDSVTHLTQFERTPFSLCYRRIPSSCGSSSSYLLRSLCDRLSALELALEPVKNADRKYTWTAENKCPERKWLDRKLKLTAEIKSSEDHELDRKYKWTAEIETPGKSGEDKKFKWTAEIDKPTAAIKGKYKGVGIKIEEPISAAGVCIEVPGKAQKQRATRVVEIEEPVDQGAIVLRQAFGKRAGALAKTKGKTKELSPLDAAQMIQLSFRAYLIRRSQALRSLRALALAKTKLKEIRVLFNNFSYRRRITRDAEERKRFSERIIALLLTVDAIQGADLMVRATRRPMLDELEAMLDVVDPQPPGKLGFIEKRKFDLPVRTFQNEVAGGVAEVFKCLMK